MDAKGNIDSLTYDALGRIKTEVRSEGNKIYYYDPSGKPGVLWKVTYPGGTEYYNYDTKGRLTSDSVSIDGTYYSTRYGYDSKNRVQTLTYPSGFAIKYSYTNFGYLDRVQRSGADTSNIWKANSMNSFGQYTQYNSGNGLVTTKTFDCLGMQRGITTGTIQNLSYSFDEETGNMISRRDNRKNLTELFSYDNLGRLTNVSGPSPLSMNYANNGNITNKTSVGDYTYGIKPHAVTEVTNPDGLISTADQRLTYTSFNKVDSLIQNNYKYTLAYGHQDQRTRSKLLDGNGTLLKTTYYVGAYEKEVIPGNPYPKEIHYIYGGDGLAAIFTKQYIIQTMYYVHKDILGSLDKITNSSGAVVDSMSFDSWGRRRNPDNWTYSSVPTNLFSRGYTGHEHLNQFDLINMNGRMYDPLLGRFLSADPINSNPFFTQDYNRYSYVLNNPFKYTDPSGYSKYLETYDRELMSDRSGEQLKLSSGVPMAGLTINSLINSGISYSDYIWQKIIDGVESVSQNSDGSINASVHLYTLDGTLFICNLTNWNDFSPSEELSYPNLLLGVTSTAHSSQIAINIGFYNNHSTNWALSRGVYSAVADATYIAPAINGASSSKSEYIQWQNGGEIIYGNMRRSNGSIGSGYRAMYIYGSYDASNPVHPVIELAGMLGNWINNILYNQQNIQGNGYFNMNWDFVNPGDTIINPITPGQTYSRTDSMGVNIFYTDTIFWIRK